jgi:hypothetical protein
MKIKIIKSSNAGNWYNYLIGEVFEVSERRNGWYWVWSNRVRSVVVGSVRCSDAEVLDEPTTKQTGVNTVPVKPTSELVGYTLKHSVADSRICVELHSKFGEYENALSRKIIDTEDKIVREGLIKLGWRPPGASTNAAYAELAAYQAAFDSQPWATDEPAKVQLDRLTSKLSELRALIDCADKFERSKEEFRQAFSAARKNNSK